jgi:hypothetical protein
VHALPLEAGAADADGVAKRAAARLHEVEPSLGSVDDDRARPLPAAVAHLAAGGVGAAEAEEVEILGARGAAEQHDLPLVVGLGVANFD